MIFKLLDSYYSYLLLVKLGITEGGTERGVHKDLHGKGCIASGAQLCWVTKECTLVSAGGGG